MTPAEVAQAQLEAYNRRDLDAFCALFAGNAEIFELGASAPACAGIAAIRERYRQLFANSPSLHSVVLSRTAFARAVVDLERITGRNGSPEPFEILAIYEIHGELIQRVHFVRP